VKYKATMVRDNIEMSYDGTSCKHTEIIDVIVDVLPEKDKTFIRTNESHFSAGNWRIVDIEEATNEPR